MVDVSKSVPGPVVTSVTQQLMDTDAETHSQTRGRATRTPEKREREEPEGWRTQSTASSITYAGLRGAHRLRQQSWALYCSELGPLSTLWLCSLVFLWDS